jgi:hypothetical protein
VQEVHRTDSVAAVEAAEERHHPVVEAEVERRLVVVAEVELLLVVVADERRRAVVAVCDLWRHRRRRRSLHPVDALR